MGLLAQSNSPQRFNFNGECNVRVVTLDGEPWFVASDVCAALMLGNVSQALSRLDEDEKDNIILNDVIGRQRSVWAVNEPGLYTLILRSDKPSAKEFKRWVTHDVLPAIRKTGSYIAPSATPLDLMEAMIAQLRRQERINAETERRLTDIETRQTSIERGAEYFTVMAFAARHGLRVDNTKAQQVGKYAARYSRKHGYPMGEAPDTRFGHVNTYHESVLRAVLGMGD